MGGIGGILGGKFEGCDGVEVGLEVELDIVDVVYGTSETVGRVRIEVDAYEEKPGVWHFEERGACDA